MKKLFIIGIIILFCFSVITVLNCYVQPAKNNLYKPTQEIDQFPIALDSSSAKTLASEAPNILFVVYDARRYDDFSLDQYGNLRHDTPFLDEFQNDAIFFSNAISPGVWTFPVHAAFFTGLRIFDLQVDYFQESKSKLPKNLPTLAGILRKFGYLTLAYPDHPYFYSGHVSNSLIKDFDYFNAIMNFRDYASLTNVGTNDGEVVKRFTLPKNSFKFSDETLNTIKKFNAKQIVLDVDNVADLDPETDIYLPKLWPLFSKSEYFYNRYQKEFDDYILIKENHDKPVFIFLNLHMCTIAIPDEKLWCDWRLLLLMTNAKKRNISLSLPEANEPFEEFYERNIKKLDLRFSRKGIISDRYIFDYTYDKQIFDNRFYDCNFQAMVNYLKDNNLLANTITIVTSDHGFSFSEHGETCYAHGGARPFDHSNVKIPLIIKFPVHSEYYQFHGIYKNRVSALDIYYTILHCSIGEDLYEKTEAARGKSLLKRISDDDYEQFIMSETSTWPYGYFHKPWTQGEMLAIYHGDYKFIHGDRMALSLGNFSKMSAKDAIRQLPHLLNPTNIFAKNTFVVSHLFNLKEDPFEQNNLIGTRKELEYLFLEKYDSYLKDRYDISYLVEPGLNVEFSKEALETLRSLGYIE
jgi:arylsulfatase A-like enzyme